MAEQHAPTEGLATAPGMSTELTRFYANWYAGAETGWEAAKRELAAVDTVAHAENLLGGSLGNIVDVGAGEGVVLSGLAQRRMFDTATALEISETGLASIRERNIPGVIDIRAFDGYKTPFQDNQFDTAICAHVIEHVEHERLFINELGRIARRVFIEIPLEGGFRGRVDRRFGHINYYTPKTFLNLLETSGLTPIKWKLFTSSRAYETYLYGTVKGPLKNLIRRSVLTTAGTKLAPHLMTFLMSVVCEKTIA